MDTLLLAAVLLLVSVPSERLFTWTLGDESDLAGYRLFQQVGHCANNRNPFKQVKQVGVQDHLWYAPPTHGTYCFYTKAFDVAGNVSTRSEKVQLN